MRGYIAEVIGGLRPRTGRHLIALPTNSLCQVQEKRTLPEENFMPCLLLIVFLAFPRIALLLLFFFSNYLRFATFFRTSHVPDAPCDQMCSVAQFRRISTPTLTSIQFP